MHLKNQDHKGLLCAFGYVADRLHKAKGNERSVLAIQSYDPHPKEFILWQTLEKPSFGSEVHSSSNFHSISNGSHVNLRLQKPNSLVENFELDCDMFLLSEDPSRITLFEKYAGFPLAEDKASIQLLEWKNNASCGQRLTIQRASELDSRQDCTLRIVFAPLDLPDNDTATSLFYLFKKYSIPSDFVSERLQSVARSFGSKANPDGSECLWFHFLCKNINTERDPDKPDHVTIKNPVFKSNAKAQSQADFSWIRAGFFLKIESPKVDFIDPNLRNKPITLLCFGASEALIGRFHSIQNREEWKEALEDPYVLLDIVLDELYLQLDGISWNLGEVYGNMERVRLL